MARTKEEWIALMDGWAAEGSLSTSQYAKWLWIRNIIIAIVMFFEGILDVFKKDTDEKLRTKQPGTVPWFAIIAKEYQVGYSLVVIDGVPQYGGIDEAAKIVTYASSVESGTDKIIGVKVAKTVSGSPAPLDPSTELPAFKDYMDARTPPGVATNITSLPADSVKYVIDASYDPLIPQTTIQDGFDEKTILFRDTLSFDAKLYKNLFIDIVQDVETLIVNNIALYWWDGTTWIEFTDYMELPAGYFDWHNSSTISLSSL